ncbi:GntR family transcriptional regulator [Rhizorhabdus dicambivorans]|uniref:GntR family transcriptional regulator n=1 Tax=Rhizorhabdus dicambivorans TaxID=1850238 RepID=A0A2A4FVQ7_9SPHN|nr:GntR family transcriptional regulator [Rhizorhabdus dicambivorans]ATE66293.1 GntR family transcriptional regulator [Rhizorhabdus dicambivorans]PCE41810.1 GntR family transcriptional regulator [Rhizorhabdus dicambivorans]
MDVVTLTDRVEGYLRTAIIEGELAPFSPLRMSTLTKKFGAGATPVREALSRLLPEGLVELSANKGFRVRGVSREDLLDIVAARTAVETEALRLSIAHGDDRWESGVVAAHYRFQKQMQVNNYRPTWAQLEAVHDELHRSMFAACGSVRLLALADQLMMQHNRYQRLLSLFTYRSQNVPPKSVMGAIGEIMASPEHAAEELVDADDGLRMVHDDLIREVLKRDSDAAIATLRDHLYIIVEEFDANSFWSTQKFGTKVAP